MEPNNQKLKSVFVESEDEWEGGVLHKNDTQLGEVKKCSKGLVKKRTYVSKKRKIVGKSTKIGWNFVLKRVYCKMSGESV